MAGISAYTFLAMVVVEYLFAVAPNISQREFNSFMDPLPLRILSGIVLAVFVFGFGLTLVILHLRAKKRIAGETLEEDEYRFATNQLRRRLQTSILITVLGIAMLIGMFIEDPAWAIAYWAGVSLVLVWIVFSAVMDIFWTRQYYGRIRHRQSAEAAYLRMELNSLKEKGSAKDAKRQNEDEGP